ncbi:MAG TPA: carboxypeptidase-like regulatory domain-containing protein, partial [Ohtaekwangia sp.]|uniref:carboxypeptidase-like regulatory domain-containing protein n=1 Tax=Ohtaekwangia sp. TaxID=2066019 RepID=UPI002F9315C2
HAQKPCGRFRPDQLKQYIPETHRAGINPWLPASVISVLLLGSHTAEAQVTTCTTPPTEEYARIGEVLLKPTEDSQRNIYREIHGTVKEAADGSLLPGINVILKGTEQGTVTDAEGKFTLRSNDLSRNSVLVFSFIGYETQEISLSSYSRQSEIVIDLNMDATVLGGVEIYYRHRWSPRAIWWKIKNIFR